MLEFLYRVVQVFLGFNGGVAKSIIIEPEDSFTVIGTPIPKSALVTASSATFYPNAHPALSAEEVSRLRKIVAYSLGFLAGLPTVPAMVVLCTDAIEKFYGAENPIFTEVWREIIRNNDVGKATAIITTAILAILSLAPFRMFYTAKSILAKVDINRHSPYGVQNLHFFAMVT